MRLKGRKRTSDDIIDVRGQPSSGGRRGFGFPTGGGGGLPIPTGKGGIGMLIVLVILLVLGGSQLFGGDGLGVDSGSLDGFPQAGAAPAGAGLQENGPDQQLAEFIVFVFDDVQAFWSEQFGGAERGYRDAKLVLYTIDVDTGCGFATSDAGPFYCPADERVYIDLGFFRELEQRFGAPGDFAQAYVVAHEVGHHVQTLLGLNGQVQQASQTDPAQANALSVRFELQADCLSGVWARSTYSRGMLEPGDIEEGLGAASAVGDDRIQASVGGRIDPESYTHGSAEQRSTWLNRGFNTGDLDACDTFSEDI